MSTRSEVLARVAKCVQDKKSVYLFSRPGNGLLTSVRELFPDAPCTDPLQLQTKMPPHGSPLIVADLDAANDITSAQLLVLERWTTLIGLAWVPPPVWLAGCFDVCFELPIPTPEEFIASMKA